MKIYSPQEWGAKINYDAWNDRFTPDDGVALHHGGGTDYPAGRAPFTMAKEIALLQSWEKYHLSKGWRGLAYGWAVGQTGNIYRIRGFNGYGAHTGDVDGDGISNNQEIVPILFLGSGNHHSLSPAAQAAIEWLRINVIEVKSPKAKRLYGHQEVQGTPTSCPGPLGMVYVKAHRLVGAVPPAPVPAPPTPPKPPIDWTKELIMSLPTLKRNDGFKSGRPALKPYVEIAQGLLLAHGFKDKNTSTPESATDGLFGAGTEAAVRAFQSSVKLKVDGIIGQSTWTKLLLQ